jgi:hypothetical protein
MNAVASSANDKRQTTNDKRQTLMTRNELIKKLGRYALLMLMAMIVLLLGNKVVAANNCNTCAGKGICNGKTDCNKYTP